MLNLQESKQFFLIEALEKKNLQIQSEKDQ